MKASEIKTDIKKAIKQFGEYTYFDKGPREVLDISKYINSFKEMKGEEVSNILFDLLAVDKKYGEAFVSAVLVELQDWDDANWSEMFLVHPELEKLF